MDPEGSHAAYMNLSPDNNGVAWRMRWRLNNWYVSAEKRMTSTVFCFVFQPENKLRYILSMTFKTRDIWRFTSEKNMLPYGAYVFYVQ